MNCEICGAPLKKTSWYEEVWGSRRKITVWECTNENCGDEEENEDESSED